MRMEEVRLVFLSFCRNLRHSWAFLVMEMVCSVQERLSAVDEQKNDKHTWMMNAPVLKHDPTVEFGLDPVPRPPQVCKIK